MEGQHAQFSTKRVLLAGGGRWSRVHASVLRRLLPPDGELLWVSRHNSGGLEADAAKLSDKDFHVGVYDDLAKALALRPGAAIVATSARAHAAHATEILQQGVHVMVEKPLTLCDEDASSLVRLAEKRGLVLGVGLHLFYASYLRHFRSLWSERAVSGGRVIWHDPNAEVRYGEIKQPDFSTPKIHDVFPHIWSILRVLFPNAAVVVEDAQCEADGAAVVLLSVNGIQFRIMLDRRANERSRRIELALADGGTADLDFTVEPGSPHLDGVVCPSDPEWGKLPSPLTLELAAFLGSIDRPGDTHLFPTMARNVVDSVHAACTAAAKLRSAEAAALASRLACTRDAKSDSTICALLADNLLPEMPDLDFKAPDAMDMLFESAVAIVAGHSNEHAFKLSARLQQSAFLKSVKACRTEIAAN